MIFTLHKAALTFKTKADFTQHLEFKDYDEIASIIKEKFDDDLKPEYILILFFMLDYYSYSGDIKSVETLGRRIIAHISEMNSSLDAFTYIDKKGIDDIEKQTRKIINKHRMTVSCCLNRLLICSMSV